MKVLLMLLAFTASVQAQGLSYIGLCNKTWDCDKTLRSFNGVPIVTGWLENSFGRACKCADKLLKKKKQKIIRVHLINSPCMRNKRCQRHEVLWGYTKVSAQRALKRSKSRLKKRYLKVVERFKSRIENSKDSLVCYVSPCLECDLNEHARKTLFNLIRNDLSTCVSVDNPYGQKCLRGYICEQHGLNPILSNPCIADMDGTEAKSLLDIYNYARKTKQCELRFYWAKWMNCLSDIFVGPSKRKCDTSIFKLLRAKEIAWKYLYSH